MIDLEKLPKLRDRYVALKVGWPDLPGETTWLDRINTWENFIDAQATADHLEILFNMSTKRYGDKLGKIYYDEDFRGLFPAIHDLLLEAFEKNEITKAFDKGGNHAVP